MPKRKVRRPGCAAGPAPPGRGRGPERRPERASGPGPPSRCRSVPGSRMAPEPGRFAACCEPPHPAPPPVYFPGAARGGVTPVPGG